MLEQLATFGAQSLVGLFWIALFFIMLLGAAWMKIK
jgi:hypothetical protein